MPLDPAVTDLLILPPQIDSRSIVNRPRSLLGNDFGGTGGRFIASKTFSSNQENIEIYNINFDVSSEIELFAFNEPDSGNGVRALTLTIHV